MLYFIPQRYTHEYRGRGKGVLGQEAITPPPHRRKIPMIRLLVVDIDGVLSLGEAAPFDGTVLQRLAAVNDRARHDPTHLATTLCTGRPAPYVEVLTQVIHGFNPAIYEHGAGLYIPEPYGFKW